MKVFIIVLFSLKKKKKSNFPEKKVQVGGIHFTKKKWKKLF